MAMAPAIERPAPVIGDLVHALDDTTCRMERLRILFNEALAEEHELVVGLPDGGGEVDGSVVDRLYNNWIIFEVVRELYADLERDIVAINEKAHADRAGRAA